ncbi:DUF4998 domain-containing protein [Pedobacter nyackensis]|uniref:BT-3044-like C-terminal domain-containing protein n=1 Tax=Pedobacter nyackensis TaxID=475255 RepID=A0A1W2DXV5_9SPHI|nr:DUF4998 domain-containing protein [Pedobacter nyackensis]SMD01886.1 protein of unknown function [Pedobacter nyackensis]
MKNKIYFFMVCIGIITSCTKMDNTYKPYLADGERYYPGKPSAIELHSGRNRIEVQFQQSLDPNITKYIIYWNDRADSVIVLPTAGQGIMKTIIPGLKEQSYNFEIVSVDKMGNSSLEVLKSGKAYGTTYESELLTRGVTIGNTLAGLELNFSTPETFNVETEVKYTNALGNISTVKVPSSVGTYTIADNRGKQIELKSAFVPSNGIDMFYSPTAIQTFNAYAGNYQATGVFHHPTNGDRNVNEAKVLARITDEIVQCNLGDLGSSGYLMQLKVNADLTVTITPAGATPDIDQHWGPNYYDPATKSFHLFYSYNISAPRRVEETIKLK